MKSVILSSAFFLLTSLNSFAADVPALKEGDAGFDIASEANNIFSVQVLKLDDYAYKIVGLDTALNGDLASTTVVLVGEKEVGGAAGYEKSFLLTPVGDYISLKSVRVKNGKLVARFSTLDFKTVTKTFKYDPKTQSLKFD